MQKLLMPFKKCMMLCGYKNPRYLKHWGYSHFGIDVSTIQGGAGSDHNIYASGDGTIIATGFDNSCGNVVVVVYPTCYIRSDDSEKDLTARYCHLSSISVKQGDKVKQGDILGIEGNTKTGDYHLHLEFDTDTKNPLYSPQVSSRDDHLTMEQGNIIKKGYIGSRDTTLNPSDILFVGENQEIVKPTYNPAWLNPSDFNIPKLEVHKEEPNYKALYERYKLFSDSVIKLANDFQIK